MGADIDPTAFLPEDDFIAPDADVELDALEDEGAGGAVLLSPDDEADLVIAESPPAPLGRSWAFDFDKGTFLRNGGRGPLETRGLATLRSWIEKCLYTDRGAHPVSPPEYGVDGLTDIIGDPMNEGVVAGLEERIRDALLFHERITDVRDFAHYLGSVEGGDEEIVYISFTVLTDAGEEIAVYDFSLGGI